MKNSEAILVTPKHFEIQECPMPEPKDNEILMKVEYVGMCGSDIHGFEFGPFIPPKDPNQKLGLGHEVAGEVVKVGAKVTKFKPGDKVLIEPGVPDDSCEYCREGRYNILGAGTIGLMVLQACLSLGATDITVVDVMQKRLDLALKLGAKRVINGKEQNTVEVLRSEELYGDHGVELVFECAGEVFTAQQAVEIVSRGGKIMMVGTQSNPGPINFLKINREVTIQTSFRYCNNYPQTIEAIATGKFNVKDMVTHVYDYKDVQKAFEEAIDPVKKCDMIKGVVKVAE